MLQAKNHVVLGTGAIGRAIVEKLVKRGESVRVVNRSGRAEEIPAGVEVVAADLFNPSQVREVTSGAKVVYQSSQPANGSLGRLALWHSVVSGKCHPLVAVV